MNETSFGQKLDYLKKVFQVTDGEIGSYVHAAPSLVCRWRSGERSVDRFDDAYTVKRLAAFFIERAALKRRSPYLAEILSLDDTDIEIENESFAAAIADYLFDGQPVRKADSADQPAYVTPSLTQTSFIGVQGVIEALTVLRDRIHIAPGTDITVYLSLEYSRLFQDEAASEIWAILYRMNRNAPVRVVFDEWRDSAEKVTQNLKALLPYLQTGIIQLYMIKSTQKYFYHNLTFFAKGAGMAITTEPVGGMGVCISLLTESAEYVKGMGAVYAGFDRMSKSLARYVGGTKDETVYYGKLFEPTEDLQMLSGGMNLLYLDEASYLSLLKINGIKGSQRNYRQAKFTEDKRKFDAFLEKHRIKEIISLPVLDRMIAEGRIITSDFTFHHGEIKADAAILKSLITGLLGYIARYENLTVYLERGAELQQDFTCRIKGDSFVLLHTHESGKNHTVYSDNWMLVYEYIKQFGEAQQSEQLMNMKDAVKAALQIRLEKLGGL